MAGEHLIGVLPNGWADMTLGAACARGGGDIQTGPFGSQLHAADYVPVGIPSIMPQNIGDNRVVEDGIARITPEDAKRLSRYLVQIGDIVYSRRGDVERRALIRETENGWLCGTGCLRVRFGDGSVDSLYASYYLGHPKVREWIVRHAHGATMPNLNTSILSALPFVVPPLEDQRAIAHILGTLDDKIELNRRMNETLEAIARAVFKSWFVDFDPVRAKASGEPPESICHRLGLTPDLLALFPDRLVDSELGEIPDGWEVKPLDGIADYLNGLALQKFPPENDSEWLPVIKISQLKKGDSVGADRASHKLKPEYIVDDGDVLFSWSGSLEVDIWCSGRGALNQHLFKVTSTNYPKWFYFYWTKHHLSHFQSVAAGKAVTMGHIQRKHLTEALCAVPQKPLRERLDEIVAPLVDKQIENRKESRTLGFMRDTLLLKLLSGELRVPVAEVEVEATA